MNRSGVIAPFGSAEHLATGRLAGKPRRPIKESAI
jgi:hypothetical protein